MWAPLLRYKITLDMQTTFGWPTSKLQGFGKPKPVEHLSTGGHHTNTLHCRSYWSQWLHERIQQCMLRLQQEAQLRHGGTVRSCGAAFNLAVRLSDFLSGFHHKIRTSVDAILLPDNLCMG